MVNLDSIYKVLLNGFIGLTTKLSPNDFMQWPIVYRSKFTYVSAHLYFLSKLWGEETAWHTHIIIKKSFAQFKIEKHFKQKRNWMLRVRHNELRVLFLLDIIVKKKTIILFKNEGIVNHVYTSLHNIHGILNFTVWNMGICKGRQLPFRPIVRPFFQRDNFFSMAG